jgi:hypothetical protein
MWFYFSTTDLTCGLIRTDEIFVITPNLTLGSSPDKVGPMQIRTAAPGNLRKRHAALPLIIGVC